MSMIMTTHSVEEETRSDVVVLWISQNDIQAYENMLQILGANHKSD